MKINFHTKSGIVIFSFLILIILLSAKLSYSQTTVNIAFGKDNTLYEDLTGSTSNGAGQYLFAGKTVTGQIRRGLVKFDLVEFVPPCATITSVTLRLHMSKTISGSTNIQLRKVLKSWGEGASDASGEEGFGAFAEPEDATWLHTYYDTAYWSRVGGDFSDVVTATSSVGGIGYYTWGSNAQMINDVQSWVNNPGSNSGWLIKGDESASPTAKRFDSFQSDSVNFVPRLTVTYTNNTLSLNLVCLIEGFWNGANEVKDTLKVSLRNSISPYAVISTAKNYTDEFGNGIFCFGPVASGSYYIMVNHRNSIETWSKTPQSFTNGVMKFYDFTSAANKAYGDNLIFKSGAYCLYSGDVNQDDIIEGTDVLLIDNDAANFETGYLSTDVNGDEIIDGSDAIIAGNNASNFITAVTP